ncbi:hypothetical protein [Nocardia sp. CA-120079]|uniref:hypothetical protein n=1 Tax=Nocardia sp. CA-120079 TaxID=3239974 RepID=UPI003D9883F5
MTVAVAPSSPDRADAELRLSRSALLYADTVTLISPKASALHKLAKYGTASELEHMRLAAEAAPTFFPEHADLLRQKVAEIEATSRAERRAQKRQLQQIYEWFQPVKERLTANIDGLLEKFGYEELKLAIDEGILAVEPIEHADFGAFGDLARENTDALPFEYIGRVQRSLLTGDSYPLFDNVTGNIIKKGVDAGILAPVPTARRRGRNAALANGFFDELPFIERATVDEVLDIRKDLRKPLGNFRRGVEEIAKDLGINPEDPEFPSAIEDAWTLKVAPALDELQTIMAENTSYRDLLKRAVNDPAGLMGMGGFSGMLVAAGPGSGMPAATAAILTGAAATAGIPYAAVRAMIGQWSDMENAKTAQFYFLYATNSRLAMLDS